MKKDILYLFILAVAAGIIVSLFQEQEHLKDRLALAPPLSETTVCPPCAEATSLLVEEPTPLISHEPQETGKKVSTHEEHDTLKRYRESLISMKLNAIEQFVPLTEDQTERLRDKYSLEFTPGVRGESLEAILGKEQATFLNDQRDKAFERGQQEAREREVFFWSRKLSLTPTQESFFLNALDDTETEIEKWKHEQKARSLQARTLLFFEETKRRRELLREKLGDVLSKDQMDTYVEQEAQSAAADVELWHSPN